MTDVATIPRPIAADPTHEYVASVPDPWLAAFRQAIRALPFYVDALEAELGDDSYQRMLTDPQVSSSIDLLKASITEDEITFTPPETPKGDAAAAARAAEITAFVQRVFNGLTTPLADVLWDMLDAIPFGARIAEEVYSVPAEGEDAGRMVLTALKPKPRQSVAFVVDAYLNIIGILGAKPGQARVLGATTLTDGQREQLLPREKFAVLTWRPRNSDPRGSSQLRPAYNPWWIKQQEWPEFLKLLFQFATPIVYGTPAEEDRGNPETGESAEDLLLKVLILLQNGSAVALRPGSQLDTIEAGEGGAAAFDAITELLNQEITKAILGSTRATMESEFGSRADSETSKSLFDSLVRAGRRTVAHMLQRDVVNQLVVLNFGRADLPLAPRVAVGGVEEEDKTPAWTAVASLERAGYIDPSQYQALDADIGLPPRTPEDVEARKKRKNAPPPTAAPLPQPGQQGESEGDGQRDREPPSDEEADDEDEEDADATP